MDLEANENTAQLIKNGLTVLGASQTCISHLLPFMCLYLFPFCGANVTVSREQCLLISIDVCTNEWQVASSIFKDQIPIVKAFQIPNKVCCLFAILSFTSFLFLDVIPLFDKSSITMPPDSVMVNCSDQFTLINGTCRPLCGKLKLYTNEKAYIDYVVLVMSSISGLLCGSMLIISSYVWRKKMYT